MASACPDASNDRDSTRRNTNSRSKSKTYRGRGFRNGFQGEAGRHQSPEVALSLSNDNYERYDSSKNAASNPRVSLNHQKKHWQASIEYGVDYALLREAPDSFSSGDRENGNHHDGRNHRNQAFPSTHSRRGPRGPSFFHSSRAADGNQHDPLTGHYFKRAPGNESGRNNDLESVGGGGSRGGSSVFRPRNEYVDGEVPRSKQGRGPRQNYNGYGESSSAYHQPRAKPTNPRQPQSSQSFNFAELEDAISPNSGTSVFYHNQPQKRQQLRKTHLHDGSQVDCGGHKPVPHWGKSRELSKWKHPSKEPHSWRDAHRWSPTFENEGLREVADTATQRERLTDQLTKGVYECMVCCESVKQDQGIWNCKSCYHVFHLSCIRRWARSSQDESGQWRCPGCQSTNSLEVTTYLCFCNKRKNPEWNRREIPHSCGEVCSKMLGDGEWCIHTCTLLCHPGPCPSCSAQANRRCPCGKESQVVKCGSSEVFVCGNSCDKLLSCGLHSCTQLCHDGPCSVCEITVEQVCFCGSTTRTKECSIDNLEEGRFECGQICRKTLQCAYHFCNEPCHEGPCKSCCFLTSQVKTCPCGSVELLQLYKRKSISERKLCTDPIPVCGQVCGKILSCGPADNKHGCPIRCHEGPCPPCGLTTLAKCRCSRNEKVIPCKDLPGMTEILCERRCNKKRQCGRHKCINVCCVDAEHICMMVCGRQLSCGLHKCQALCHAGNCSRCYNVSFDELHCHCGAQVLYPPVPCGARPPECSRLCSRAQRCGHEPQHNCHPEERCPPCTVLCEKQCYGKHEVRKNVPCHLIEISCGKACGKPLPCGRHQCILTCHTGGCAPACSQPCTVSRTECGHPCGVACHSGPCPGNACREKVKVQCQCGQRTATVSCEEQQSAYRKMATALLASKMTAIQSGESVNYKDLLGPNSSTNKTKSLDCTEDCALAERNRRLALALQIKNPNPKPGAPRFQDLLKDWAKKDPRFVQMVHDKLTELVQLAKQSAGKMRSRSYSFDPMNRDKRQFIHEYCIFFGCESVSYDEEPKRNVVTTAFGETSFLPAVGVLEVTQREMGQRKMPAPPSMKGIINQTVTMATGAVASSVAKPTAWGKPSAGGFKTLSEVVKSNPTRPTEATPKQSTPAESKTSAPVVDYFDFTS